MQAKDVMSTKLVTVTPANSIWHAAQIMREHDVSGLPVVDDNGEVVGVFTEGDLMERIEIGPEKPAGASSSDSELEPRINAYLKRHSWSVGDVMTTRLIAVEEETPLAEVASLMKQHRIKRVPVVRGRKLVGIVSRKDLLRAIAAPVLEHIASGDAALQRSVVTRFGENSELQGAKLTVVVADGIVRLGGTVTSEAERRLACVIAEGVHGVGGVRNEIEIVERGNTLWGRKSSIP